MSGLHLGPNPTLADLQQYMRDAVAERGFADNVPQRFMLLIEEVGELSRAARKRAGMKFAEDTHTAELDSEAADVLIVLLGLCNLLNIDLEQAFRDKEEKNKQRSWR